MVRSYPDNVPACFRLAVAEYSDRFAIRSATERFTYLELDARTDALCERLQAAGIGKGALVGILLDRAVATVTSFLAVLKAGGVFVPLDPNSPPSELLQIAERHQLSYLISDSATLRRVPELASIATVVNLDLVNAAPHGAPAQTVTVTGADPACVMFTSGSTGQPKGVVIPHAAIVRLVKDPGYMEFSPDQIFLQASPLAFDASIFEIWGALLNGAELVIPSAGLLSLDTIAAAIEEQAVTTLFLTSGLFNLMIDQRPEPLRKLRYLVSGGDVMSPTHVAKAAQVLDSGRFISVYGPTENTTFTTCYTAPPELPVDQPVPIGLPVAGTVMRILDADMRAVPEGTPGELYVGGVGLALGYLNAPDLTEGRFIVDPEDPAQRLYRTGDLVRRDETGLLHFLGRMDNQIKVNGFRIEPEHVEAVLRRHLSLTDIAVVACALSGHAKHLVAFVIPLRDASISEAAFRATSTQHLPPHLIPARLEIIDEFPLTKTGKIDRLTLSRLAAQTREQKPANGNFSTPEEATLADVWRRQLSLDTIDVDQNFFDLGGTSLQLLGVHAELEQFFPGKFAIRDLFDLPTIRLLHGRLVGAQTIEATSQAATQGALQRRANQNRAAMSALRANLTTGN